MPQIDYLVTLKYLEIAQLTFCFLKITTPNNAEKFKNQCLVHLITRYDCSSITDVPMNSQLVSSLNDKD